MYISPFTNARHVHYRQLYKHHARQLVVPAVISIEPSSTAPDPASFTAGDAAIADIQAIQDGLSDLPKDLLTSVQTMQHRMEEMEALLQSLISGSSGLASSSRASPEPIEPTSTATTPIPDFTGLSIPLTQPFETTLSTVRATHSSKVSSSTSQSLTVTRTTHITRTHTVTPAIVTAPGGFFPANGTANGSHPTPTYPYASGSWFPVRA